MPPSPKVMVTLLLPPLGCGVEEKGKNEKWLDFQAGVGGFEMTRVATQQPH